ncbi:MAG: glycosyltransferase family 2 protein [Bacteroides sp.]|nr:glycosyltransferase family 2 protein [Bacteroides sp.]MCM1084871.1 glycosyltransferase family 2 protein [Bacteroides sp.]
MARVGVVIPVFNHAARVGAVINGVIPYGLDVFVVDDGSVDDVRSVLAGYGNRIVVCSYPENRGKGYALRQGFMLAQKAGCDHVLTIDADGQHRPEDIPLLLREMQHFPEALILGSRSFTHKNMPSRNTFANCFSNFWFWVQTGKKIPDTQTGFRIYPLWPMNGMKFFTSRYETELEMLVRLAWKGVGIVPVEVQVHYFSKRERVSHFRPFLDFLRISLLNTVFTLMAFFYAYPNRWLHGIKRNRR